MSDRETFVQQAACEIEERLHIVAPREQDEDPYMIAGIRDRPNAYVQCLFESEQITCEAASGHYGDGPVVALTPAVREALTLHGFSTDGSEGNFLRQWVAEDLPGEVPGIARMLAELLHDIYGARTLDDLEYDVPGEPDLAHVRLCEAGMS